MNIIYASENNYAKHMAASLYSLFDHNRDQEEINVFILSSGMSKETVSKIKGIVEEFGRALAFIDVSNLEKKFPFPIDMRGFNINSMSRLFSAELLPEWVEQAIYIDCDTIVADSLKGMWETDIGTNLIGAVMEPSVGMNIKKGIDLTAEDPYFNAGVLLMNLKQWRKEGVQEELLRFYQKKGGDLFACDQDILNGTLKGRIYSLPPKYNFFTNYKYFRYKALVKKTPMYDSVGKDAFEKAKKEPAILHYLGDERPWKKGNLNPYRKIYEEYLDKTPWRGTPKETGMEIYLFLYHVMNLLTFICPPFREWININYGMKVIDSRKKK